MDRNCLFLVRILRTPCPLHTAIWKRVFAVLITVLMSKTEQNLKLFCFFQGFPLIFLYLQRKLNKQLKEIQVDILSIGNKSIRHVLSQLKHGILNYSASHMKNALLGLHFCEIPRDKREKRGGERKRERIPLGTQRSG